jgi:hypothetical protein
MVGRDGIEPPTPGFSVLCWGVSGGYARVPPVCDFNEFRDPLYTPVRARTAGNTASGTASRGRDRCRSIGSVQRRSFRTQSSDVASEQGPSDTPSGRRSASDRRNVADAPRGGGRRRPSVKSADTARAAGIASVAAGASTVAWIDEGFRLSYEYRICPSRRFPSRFATTTSYGSEGAAARPGIGASAKHWTDSSPTYAPESELPMCPVDPSRGRFAS